MSFSIGKTILPLRNCTISADHLQGIQAFRATSCKEHFMLQGSCNWADLLRCPAVDDEMWYGGQSQVSDWSRVADHCLLHNLCGKPW